MKARDIRVASFEPTGRTTLVVLNYDSLVRIIRPARVAQYLSRVRPGRDTVLVVDELDEIPDLGEHPLPENRRTSGWEDWRVFARKGPGNSWKIHRETKFWGGINRVSVRHQQLIQREAR